MIDAPAVRGVGGQQAELKADLWASTVPSIYSTGRPFLVEVKVQQKIEIERERGSTTTDCSTVELLIDQAQRVRWLDDLRTMALMGAPASGLWALGSLLYVCGGEEGRGCDGVAKANSLRTYSASLSYFFPYTRL